jgi:hypothetical protein
MTDERDDNLSPRLAQAVLQLVETPAAGERPADLDALVLHALRRSRAKRRVPPAVKFSLAAALVIAAAVVGWVARPGKADALYGAVAQRLEKLHSIVYWVQWVDEAGLAGAVAGDGDKVIHVAPSHGRIEKAGGAVIVVDTKLEKAIELDPARKRARVVSGQMAGHVAAMARGPAGLLDTLRKHFRPGGELPAGVEVLEDREIDGVQAAGFRSTVDGEIVDAWIDPATNLPLEVRIRLDIPAHVAANDRAVRMWRVITNLEFDVAVDPALLSVAVPAGYAVVEIPDVPIAVNTAPPALADLVELLRLCARHNNSTFPDSLAMNDSPGTCMAIMKRFADSQEGVFESGTDAEKRSVMKAVTELGASMGRATRFLFSLRPENKLRYDGAGVKLDTPGKPILWFSPGGNTRYQVVYADLSVKELAESELPPPAPPAAKGKPRGAGERQGGEIYRSTSPRVMLPRSAVTKFAELERIRREGRQAEVRFLELTWMSEFIQGNNAVDANAPAKKTRFKFLEAFRNLEGLKVEYLTLTDHDLAVIGRLHTLKRLSLSGVQIAEVGGGKHFLRGAELAHLDQLANLELLDLSQSDFSGGLAHLAGLPKLHALILSSFEHLNDASVAELKQLPHLQTLVLAGVYYTNPEKTITDAGLASLAQLPSLRTLYVEPHGKFTLPVDKLQTLLPEVDVRRGYVEE